MIEQGKSGNDEESENNLKITLASETVDEESLVDQLVSKLTLGDEACASNSKKRPVLTNTSLDAVVEYIKRGKCKNIITMAGAGISTSAGIPDFRSPESGLYNNLSKYDLPFPEAIFYLPFFKTTPEPFFALAKELYPGTFNPTSSHYFIKLLEDKGLLLRHYTQNIDTLERVAGISDDKLVEAHGTFHTSHCITCNKQYEQEWVKDKIFSDITPKCEDCEGLVKPDIVFFGEKLPDRFNSLENEDFSKCDLLIIMGTSLTVQPFSNLIYEVSKTCPRVLINREKVGDSPLMDGDHLAFDSKENTRDVAIIGDCDEGCQQLIEKLGWKAEFDELCKRETLEEN